jgi:sigma-B regulation protein RsbU (phosphoserine phosphatase)
MWLREAARAVPWVVVSAIFLFDALTLGPLAASPWALLILAPVVVDNPLTGAGTLFSAALPIAAGLAEAAGAFSSGAPRLANLVPLALSLAAAAAARFLGLKRQELLARGVALQGERERSLANLRDAEVEIAARIQRALLLDPPGEQSGELILEAITVASNAVDGDFYGFIPYSQGQVDVLIGDVMGKGVPAALVGAALKSAFLRSSLRLILADPDSLPEPDALVSAVHDSVVQELMDLDSFATLQYGRVDALRLRLDFVDCGHTALLHYDSNLKLCWTVRGTNLPIGFTPDKDYARYIVPLASGDRLLFYSDGVSEAPNAGGELFGEKRLSGIITSNATLEPRELVKRILNTAMYFASEGGFKDDVTCVAVSIEPVPARIDRAFRDFSCQAESLAGLRSFLNNAMRPESENLKDRLLAAAIACADRVIDQVGSKLQGPGASASSADCQSDSDSGSGLDLEACAETEDLDSPLEELEGENGGASSSGASLVISAYRVEYIRAPDWVTVRILYHGKPLPWERGRRQTLCALAPSDSVYCAEGGELNLVCLVFPL